MEVFFVSTRAPANLIRVATMVFSALTTASVANTVMALECVATPPVLSNTSLSGLADFWFGSPDFRYAILLATNSRVSDPRFSYINDSNNLPTGSATAPNHVCIPGIDEAERLKLRFDGYLDAIHDMALAEPSEVVNTLNPVPSTGPVTVVSWVREDQLKAYPTKVGAPVTAKADMWVTLAPYLQEFCQQFTATVSTNPDRTVLRLEQRLGLPPAAGKTHFVELEIETPADNTSLFRPCGDPNVTTTSCALGGPSTCSLADDICHARADFFVNQYYSAFGTARPVEYPWTSLGYTFDWAYKPVGLGGRFDFVRVGESEYVVPEGVNMRLVSIQSTEEYCGLLK